MLEINFTILAHGAVFDGRAALAAHLYAEHVKETLADEAVDRIHSHLAGVIRKNRGVYMAFTHQVKEGDDIVVTDRWIVYGPWLEGVGSRVGPPGSGRWPMTRFMGYHTYRVVAQELQLDAEDIALRELPPYLAVMND